MRLTILFYFASPAPYWKYAAALFCSPNHDIYNFTLSITRLFPGPVVWFSELFLFPPATCILFHTGTNPEFPRLALQEGSHWLWGNEKELFDGSQPEVYNAWADRFGGAYRIDGALWVSSLFLTPFCFVSIADFGRLFGSFLVLEN